MVYYLVKRSINSVPIWGRGRWNSFPKHGVKEWVCFVLGGITCFKKFSEIFFFYSLGPSLS